MKNPIILKDALHNCSKREVRDRGEYGRGVLVGAVSAIMAVNGMNFDEAFALVKTQLPHDMHELCYPFGWEKR